MSKPVDPVTMRRALSIWRDLCDKHDRFEDLALELYAHPDAKPEELALVREKLIAARQNMRTMYKQTHSAWMRSPLSPFNAPKPPRFMKT